MAILSVTRFLLVAVAAMPAAAQELVSVKGQRSPLRGSVTARDQQHVRFNPYYSTQAEMVWGVQELPAGKVKAITRDVPPVEEFLLRLAKHKGSADALCDLAEWCHKHKLGDEAKLAALEALRADPAHARAIKLAGGRLAAERFVRSDPRCNPKLRSELDRFLAEADAEKRKALVGEIRRTFGTSWNETYFARAWRSAQIGRGLQEDRPLTFHGDEVKGVYTLYVPHSYDPFTPTPLLIGLHGGGPGGKDRDRVVGSGKSAMPFYRQHAEELGWIVACPTAIRAPWRDSANDPWIRSLVDELEMLFNVDVNRVYLTGHSMGGFGTWYFGPKYCERWAAIGPCSGGGSNGIARLRKTGTFVYLYHGGNDNVVSPADSRRAARALLRGGNDFVYSEMPKSGHGFPRAIRDELFAFFDRKRLHTKKGIGTTPLSSFLEKESRDEAHYFGRLLNKKTAVTKAGRVKALVSQLSEGGGAGKRAAAELESFVDASMGARLARVVRNKKLPADGRALAAGLLGKIGDKKHLSVLGRAAREHDLGLFHASVGALAQIEDKKTGEWILDGIAAMVDYFESRITGSRIGYTDWDAVVPEIGYAVRCLGNHPAKNKNERLKALVVARVLERKLDIPTSPRVRQDASRARRILQDAVAGVMH